MCKVKQLFDQSRDIYRTIEKVISYGAAQEQRLKAEIQEYIVTESIEDQLEKLLSNMQLAMESGGESDVGVWVSGFYGSGKSSLTKYLGLAFDESITIDRIPFIQHLKDRLHKPQTKAILTTVAKRFPASVIMLDLAAEMLAEATMKEVSTVLYYKVLQWAGYSQNLKVAALERKLRQDGKYEDFKYKVLDSIKVEWESVQNDPLVLDSIVPELAHCMYPELFKTPTAFSTETGEYIRFENKRVEEMINIVRETSGKDNILFIIDEVGQYVAPRPNLILNVDGLAKNLKNLGDGKIWLFGTAQQTLTEDDQRAALNSPELFKLKDRFPIWVDLESDDIKEICYERLLGKSKKGEDLLAGKFDEFGQQLRHNTKLQDAKYYVSELDKKTFIDLYPFPPALFDILLHLLGALAKSTGGIGLRSAIKVIQDILIEEIDGNPPMAELNVGRLATAVTLYNTLKKDIQRAFPSIYHSVGKVIIRFKDSPIHQNVAKTVAILQILDNLPVTSRNVACLMHPGINSSSQLENVESAIEELISDPTVPFGEQDGNLRFFSEKLNDIERERAQIPLRSLETLRIYNEIVKEVFSPLPSARIEGSLTVKSGIRSKKGPNISKLAGERETIQTIIELVDPAEYTQVRKQIKENSCLPRSRNEIYLLGRHDPMIEEKVAEIYRSREVVRRYRNEPDQEVKDYCQSQKDRAEKLTEELTHIVSRAFTKGSLLFRGKSTAIDSLGSNHAEACNKNLQEVAKLVFDRYSEAAVRVETAVAEKFLRSWPNNITQKIDPLGLVQKHGDVSSPDTDHKALVSLCFYIDNNVSVEGRRLIDHFSAAPFGWSPDTLRYLVASLLVAGKIKLNVSGRQVTVNGQKAIEALRTNNAFKPIGVSLRDRPHDPQVLSKASKRLTDLIGEKVLPLEDEISKKATKHLPLKQNRYAPLGVQLISLGLPGKERIAALSSDIADILFTDGSEATDRLGGEQSSLYENLEWAGDVEAAFRDGLDTTLKALQEYQIGIESLPSSGIPGCLKEDLSEDLEYLEDMLGKIDFFKHTADLNSLLTKLKNKTKKAAEQMDEEQFKKVEGAKQRVAEISEWQELNHEERAGIHSQLDELITEISYDLQGIKQLINRSFDLGSKLNEIKSSVEKRGRSRRKERLQDEIDLSGATTLKETLSIKQKVTSRKQLEDLIVKLQALQDKTNVYQNMEITIITEE